MKKRDHVERICPTRERMEEVRQLAIKRFEKQVKWTYLNARKPQDSY